MGAARLIRELGPYRWVGLYDVAANEIAVVAWDGPEGPTYPRFPISQGLNGAAVASGEPVVVQDVALDPRYLTTIGGTRGEMIQPVLDERGTVLGTIDVESDRIGAFSERDERLLSACAGKLRWLWETAAAGGEAAVRYAVIDDAPEMTRLSAELGYPISLEDMTHRLASLLPSPHHCVAVAANGGTRLLGWMHVEQRRSLEGGERAELMGLVVDSAARRSGIGRRLVAAAEAWAAARGLAALTVRSNTLRELSHPFYEALGYTRSKTQHVYTKTLA